MKSKGEGGSAESGNVKSLVTLQVLAIWQPVLYGCQLVMAIYGFI